MEFQGVILGDDRGTAIIDAHHRRVGEVVVFENDVVLQDLEPEH